MQKAFGVSQVVSFKPLGVRKRLPVTLQRMLSSVKKE